ncbi:MAG: hypothetical protein P9M15_03645 [Candidatus Electryoneaceae bacterium]|nr:hypothetical protein [Candidatus Electryoneaceae bacterium]
MKKSTIQKLYDELVKTAQKLVGDIRYGKGRFRTGVCSIHGEKVLLINNLQPIEERISALIREIDANDSEEMDIKPIVRIELERYRATSTPSDRQ